MGFGQTQPTLLAGGAAGRGRNWTAELWDGFDPAAVMRDPSLGYFEQDDFLSPPNFPANTAITAAVGRYKALTTNNTGSQIVDAAAQGGGLSFENAATGGDNDEQYMQGGRAFVLATAAEDDTFPFHHIERVRWEARFRLSSVADDITALFIGLDGKVLTTGDLVNDTGALVSTFHGIGFSIVHENGGATNANAILKFVYQEDGSALQTPIASVATLVADTWYTIGMDFDPRATKPESERISIYYNGTKQSTFVTAASVAASTFPKSTDSVQIPMAFTVLRKAGSDAAGALTLGGYRIFGEPIVAQGNESCA